MLYACVRAVVYFVYIIVYRFRVSGRENVPPGGTLVCANHTSLSDPILIALALTVGNRPFFMAKAELFKISLFGNLLRQLGAFPVERKISDLGAVKRTLNLLKQGHKVLMFPQGTRIPEAEITDIKSGAAMLALRTGCPILPVFITPGRKMFINRIEISFGSPFVPEKKPEQDKSEAYAEISSRLAYEIQSLADI